MERDKIIKDYLEDCLKDKMFNPVITDSQYDIKEYLEYELSLISKNNNKVFK